MKCVVCKNVLSGKQRRYCSDSCYSFSQTEKQKENYRKASPFLKNRACVFCNTIFRPRNEAHICCNKYCRIVLENRKRRDAPKKPRGKALPRFWEYRVTKVEERVKKKDDLPPNEDLPPNVPPNVAQMGQDGTIAEDEGGVEPEVVVEGYNPQPLPTTNSNYLVEMEDFKRKGGEVQLLPSQLDGRTPGANARCIWGWSVETWYGFGYEIGILEEFMEEMQDAS